jgi:hypothetical protein
VRARATPGADLATCAFRNVDDDGSDLSAHDGRIWVFPGEGVHLASAINVLGGAGMAVRRSVFDAVGGFHEIAGVGYEDWAFLAKAVLAGHRLVAVPDPLYRYRIRATSMLRSTSRYRNMLPVHAEFARHLPPALAELPAMVDGIAASLVVPPLPADGRDARIRQLEAEVQGLALHAVGLQAVADQREAMLGSTTWRVGRAVVGPCRVALRIARTAAGRRRPG